MFLALVDLSGGEEYLELVRGALQAALEALPSTALFGLITFANQVCRHATLAAVPHTLSLPEAKTRCQHPGQSPCAWCQHLPGMPKAHAHNAGARERPGIWSLLCLRPWSASIPRLPAWPHPCRSACLTCRSDFPTCFPLKAAVLVLALQMHLHNRQDRSSAYAACPHRSIRRSTDSQAACVPRPCRHTKTLQRQPPAASMTCMPLPACCISTLPVTHHSPGSLPALAAPARHTGTTSQSRVLLLLCVTLDLHSNHWSYVRRKGHTLTQHLHCTTALDFRLGIRYSCCSLSPLTCT